MKTTDQILNLLNPISKSGKSSKHLISKLSKGTGTDFKEILTSLDIGESEKSAIILELLKQVEGKKLLNNAVNKSDILDQEKLLSGKYKKYSTKELSSEGNASNIVKSKLLITKPNGRQIRNLVVNEKASGIIKSANLVQNISKEAVSGGSKINEQKKLSLVQNISKEAVSGGSKINEQKKLSLLNKNTPSNSLLRENIKKDSTPRIETDEITKVNLNKLNVLDKGIVNSDVIKKFGAQIKAAQITTPVITNVIKESLSKSNTEQFTNLTPRPKIDPESLEKLITTSAEKALSKNVNVYRQKVENELGKNAESKTNSETARIIAPVKNGTSKNNFSLGKNEVFESKSAYKIIGNSNPVAGRSEESDNEVMTNRIKDFSKRTGKALSSDTTGKTTNSKVHNVSVILNRTPNIREIRNKNIINEKNIDTASIKANQTGKAVLNDNSFYVNGKNLPNSQYMPSTISINKSMRAFNSAGKRVNTVAVQARKVTGNKSVKSSKQIQSSSSVINLKMVQKTYNKQSELSNFEKEQLNISKFMIEKFGNGFESSERYDNNLVKLKTTFFSNGVALNTDKMFNTHQMKLSVKMINDELSKLQLRISPKGLGNIIIDIQKEGNALYTKFVAETAEVASLLRETLPELKETLALQGLKMEDTQISSKEDELRQYLSEKKDNEFEEKSNKKQSNLSQDYPTEIAPELLGQKSAHILSPYSTVEYLA